MMEGKEGKLVEEEEPEFIKVESIHFNNGSDLCGVTEPVNIEIAFTALDPLQVAHWEFKYLVDCIQQRNIIILGETPKQTYASSSLVCFESEPVNVSHIKPSHLTNAGLLICTLFRSGEEITEIKLVVQVNLEEGQLTRTIYNPLD